MAVKSGRSSAGARASSHTGALLAASDVTVDALFRQAGVIRTDTLDELFDVAALLANQPLPAGRRVAIVTNAGGPGILCADTCEAQGWRCPALAGDRGAARVPAAEASLANPVDMIASATAEQYRQALGLVAADPNVDAVVAIFIPPLATRDRGRGRALIGARRPRSAASRCCRLHVVAMGSRRSWRPSTARSRRSPSPRSAAIAPGARRALRRVAGAPEGETRPDACAATRRRR